MDTNMEDVGRVPAEMSSATLEPTTIPTVDGWIEGLMSCKQLPEVDVQRLCEKVSCCLLSPGILPLYLCRGAGAGAGAGEDDASSSSRTRCRLLSRAPAPKPQMNNRH